MIRVDVPEVTSPTRSVVVTRPDRSEEAVVLVHGIMDDVQRWLLPSELTSAGLTLPERFLPPPLFDSQRWEESPWGRFTPRLEGRGLASFLADHGFAAVAYSYQDFAAPVAPIDEAARRLHAVVGWVHKQLQPRRVHLIGHSRGGLICRYALLNDSQSATASDFQRSVSRLITIATPHLGSSVARVAEPFRGALERFEEVVRATSMGLIEVRQLGVVRWLAQFIETLCTLQPDSPDVAAAAADGLPSLPAGYQALAGVEPLYFACDLALLGRFRFPPNLEIPETTPGQGDMAVSVASALAIPESAHSHTAQIAANHLTLTVDPSAHQQILQWLTE